MRLLLAPLLLLLALPAQAVKREDFKECGQTSFCRRLRALSSKYDAAESASPGSFQSPYTLGPASPSSSYSASAFGAVSKGDASWTFPLTSSLYPDISFELRVDILAAGDEGIARVRVDEVGSASPWRRYNETARWVLLDAEPKLASSSAKMTSKNGVTTITYGEKGSLSLEITHQPLRIVQKRDSVEQVVFNERALFHMEHFRTKEIEMPEVVKTAEGEEGEPTAEVKAEPGSPDVKVELESPPPEEQKVFENQIDRSWFETEDNDMFEENWKRWRDSKPKGKSTSSISC